MKRTFEQCEDARTSVWHEYRNASAKKWKWSKDRSDEKSVEKHTEGRESGRKEERWGRRTPKSE